MACFLQLAFEFVSAVLIHTLALFNPCAGITHGTVAGLKGNLSAVEMVASWFNKPYNFTFTYLEPCDYPNCNPTCPIRLKDVMTRRPFASSSGDRFMIALSTVVVFAFVLPAFGLFIYTIIFWKQAKRSLAQAAGKLPTSSLTRAKSSKGTLPNGAANLLPIPALAGMDSGLLKGTSSSGNRALVLHRVNYWIEAKQRGQEQPKKIKLLQNITCEYHCQDTHTCECYAASPPAVSNCFAYAFWDELCSLVSHH